MAVLLFKLANVPDDEAEDIRQLLREREIYFYETSAGMWRVGLDAIWLPDASQQEQASSAINAYQQSRLAEQREVYAKLETNGEAPTLWQNMTAQPIRFIAMLLAVAFVLAISIVPFWFFSAS